MAFKSIVGIQNANTFQKAGNNIIQPSYFGQILRQKSHVSFGGKKNPEYIAPNLAKKCYIKSWRLKIKIVTSH